MPKSLHKIECISCNKSISASMFLRHLNCDKDLHEKTLNDLEEHRINLSNKSRHCKRCNKKLENHCYTLNEAMSDMFGISRNNIKRTCSKECKNIPWNTGLTKEFNKSLERMSKSRMGHQNPIFKVVNDECARKKWIQNFIKGRSDYDKSRQGKTLAEFMGADRAKTIQDKMSKSAKIRSIHGHTGHKHSLEARIKIGQKTVKWIKASGKKTSLPQKELYKLLCENLNEIVELEYIFSHYCIDIAIPDLCLAIEVDGDFFHANKSKGFDIKYRIQKNNVNNDKRKNTYLKNNNWEVLRFWASDIKEDISCVLTEIKNKIFLMRSLQ